MSRTIKKLLIILTLAGILLTPACSNLDDELGSDSLKEGVTATSQPSNEQGDEVDNTTDKPKETEETIHVITNDKELEEYFNSISDEEIENLLKIIEDIDIASDIDPEADPGFDDVVIP